MSLSKRDFMAWNAALISKATGWNHSLMCPWPNDPDEDANRLGGLERYLEEMQAILNYMREDAGLPIPVAPLLPIQD